MTTFTTFATATFATGNIVVVQSAENMIPGLPISFTGNTFGNVTANATFYIGNITFGFPTSNITLTSLPGGAVYALANGSGNMTATFSQGGQQIIPTVAPGEPLNQAFDAVNVNFDQIFAAGPVGSNIQIDQNTIYTLNTNGNLVLNPNGIGNVIANAHVIPDQDRVRNLGAFALRWNTVYAQNFVGNGGGISNITVSNISNGSTNITALANANITVTVAGTANVAVFTPDGLLINGTVTSTGNIVAPTFIGNLVGNITGNIDAGGANTQVQFNDNDLLAGSPGFTFNKTTNAVGIAGTVTAGNMVTGGTISATGNIIGNYFIGNGSQLTGLPASYTDANVTTLLANLGANIINGTGSITTTANISGNYILGNGSQLTGITADNVNADDLTGNTLSGNVIFSSLTTLGNLVSLSVIGNTTTGNLDTAGFVSATGNVTGNYILGNGALLTGVITSVANINNGNSNVTISGPGSDVTVGVDGIGNVAVFSSDGLEIAGDISVTGNISSGNLYFGSGIVSGTGNIYADKIFANIVGNIDAAGNLTEIQFNTTGDQLGASANFTYDSDNNVFTVNSGNIVGGNVLVGANISAVGNVHGSWFVGNVDAEIINATANITGGNVLTNGQISATGTGTFGNVLTGGTVSATSTIQGGNVLTPGDVSATGSLTGGNVFTGGVVSAVSTITGGNLVTSGQVTSTGTITGGNVVTAGFVSAVGDVAGGNVVTAGFVSATGTGTFGNISTAGAITAAGNITGNYIFGNGSQLTGIDTNLIKNGNSNVRILTANGNISMDVNGTSNVVVVTPTGIDIAGAVTSTGTANVGNVTTTGFVSATGNVTGGNVNTGSLFSSGQLTIAANASGVVFSTTGNVNVSNVHINNLADPVQAQDAATKSYVDAVAEGLVIDAPAEAATPNTLANISVGTITYNNGNAGISATLVTTGTYANIDGVNIATVGTRILVKDEANLAHNGIYTYANSTALVRATDYDQPSEITGHDFVFVVSGNTYAGTGWVNIDAVTTVGTDPIEWVQFSGAGTIQAGNGIAVNGTQVNVLTDGITTGINGSNQVEVIPNAQLTTPNIGAATGTSVSVTGNVQSANLLTSGVVTATGTVTAGNISTGGFVSATGNIGGGNLLTGGLISSTGTITSDNTITGGNVVTAGFVSATGDVTGGNIATAGSVTATGTGTFGNIATAGSVTATGDVTSGNVYTTGIVSAVSNVTGGNLITGGYVTATGTVYGGNVLTPGEVSAGGSLTGGNIFTGGQISAVSTITGGNVATAGFVSAAGNITGGNIVSAGQISSTGNITAPTFLGNLEGTTVTSTGNITGGNILFGSGIVSGTGNIYANKIFANIVGNVDAAGNLYEIQFNSTGDQLGATANFTYDFANNVFTVANGNIVGGNLLLNNNINANGNITTGGFVSAAGNITAPTFIGNLVGNITGNIDAGGANTEIQFNDDNILAGSPGFTFDKTSNLVTITGNVTAGNVASQGIITANLGVYGDIYTTSIDSADSSAVIVTPDMILLSSLDVNQDITVGNIVIPSSGNITVGNVRIANLATPVFDQDAVTKQYVDSAIGNVLPIITNQTIDPDGSSLTYTLDQSTTAVGVLVTINGISQTPNDSYSVSGNTITFAETLLTSDIVQVRFLSGTSSGGGGVQSSIANGTSNVNLATANGNATITANAVTYTFGTNSTLTLPGGSRLRPLGSNLDIFAGTGSYVQLNNSDESSYIGVDSAGGYIVTAGGTWGFSTTGNLTAPGNVSAVGNITGGNILTGAQVIASGVIESGTGFSTGGYLSVDGSADLHNTTVTGNLSATGNVTAQNFIGNISITGNVTGTSANVDLVAGVYDWSFDNTGNLTLPGNTFAVNYANNTPVDVVTRFEGTWTVPVGNSTQSFTVSSGTYSMWVESNIPNGIIAWNATATVTNTNVPVVGAQYAWVYNGGGTPIDFTSIPNQFTGTANTIVRSNVAPSSTTNRFDFGINNTSGNSQTVRYGWIQIS
jgi:filamentous hemagglutinin